MVLFFLFCLSECIIVVFWLSCNLQACIDFCYGLFDGQVIYGILEKEEIIFWEYGLLFFVNVVKGYKIGYFFDYWYNWKCIGELVKEKIVFDVFVYVGGFFVYVLVGGVIVVISLDISV